MIQLKANRPLSGDYGNVRQGESFYASEEVAKSLESRGLAERMLPPLENKVLRSFEVKPVPRAPAPKPKAKKKRAPKKPVKRK